MQQYIISAIWLAGFLLSFWMLRVEHEAESEQYTHGDKVLSVLLSILSFAMVLFILVKAWAGNIGAKGYWSKPVKQVKQKTE
jgi:hypothetical protein